MAAEGASQNMSVDAACMGGVSATGATPEQARGADLMGDELGEPDGCARTHREHMHGASHTSPLHGLPHMFVQPLLRRTRREQFLVSFNQHNTSYRYEPHGIYSCQFISYISSSDPFCSGRTVGEDREKINSRGIF